MTETRRTQIDASPGQRDDPRAVALAALSAAAACQRGAAVVIGADGVICMSNAAAQDRHPPGLPFVETDDGRWSVSAPVHGLRLASLAPPDPDEAAASASASERFTAAVSHEIRTPLNGILGMAALLDETRLNAAQADYVKAIRKSGARLLDLLNNVLDYSRLEASATEFVRAAFEPAELIQDVVELLSPRAHAAGLDLAGFVAGDLPPVWMGDADRLRQVLFNLAGNAIKFTEQGAVAVSASAPHEGGLLFSVRDTGCGIPPDAHRRLFEAFGQARASDARRDGGVGLGLAIVARLVSGMGGTVRVHSQAGEGARFDVWLPLETSPTETGSRDRPPSAGERVRVGVSLPPASLLAVVSALPDRDWQVETLSDSLPDGAAPAVQIIDATMSPARIMRIADRCPTLVALRQQDRSEIERFRRLGCAGYLIRPLRAGSVLERVRLALRGELAGPDEAGAGPDRDGDAARVLIADDNAVNALLAAKALTAAGYAVDTCGTGVEALEAVGNCRYGLILMDIRMPVMDGLEATRQIRALQGAAARTPIVALTADLDPGLEARARQAGVSAIASKPIDPVRLRQLAAEWSGRPDADAGSAGKAPAAP